MELDPQIMQQLLQLFSAELDTQIQSITDGLLNIEKGIEGDERRTAFEEIFRAAHNIKGAAQGVNAVDVSTIAHQLESLFSLLKRDNRTPTPELIDLSLESMDCMHKALKAFIDKTPLDFEIAPLLQRIESHITKEEPEATKNLQINTATSVSEFSQDAPMTVEHDPEVERAADAAAMLVDDENEKLATDLSASEQSRRNDDSIRVAVDKLEIVAAAGEALQVSRIEMDDHFELIQQLSLQLKTFSKIWARAKPLAQHHGKSLPVEIMQLLERGASSIGELSGLSNHLLKEMRSSTNRLGILSNVLQNDIRMLRLVPVASLLRPMSRTVRDIGRELGKQVDYETIGDDIEMDRAVLDGVRDPLIHLLRNAIDHGIENPAQRKAAGKSATGKVSVQVQAVGSQIRMLIKDDGAGIDVDKIAEIARKRKVATSTELALMSEEDILDLIFRPGFSSKEIVTNVSGRGVGLDVVRANLRRLKGRVELHTQPGTGSTFVLNLPLTLATDQGLMVGVNGNVFVIPSTSVDRVLELVPEDIIEIEANQAIIIDGRTIPLRRLTDLLEMPSHELSDNTRFPVVLVSKGRDIIGFVVEEILGEREIVIKSLQAPLVSVRNVTGGTLTGSGDIVIVLNPYDLIESALKRGITSRILALNENKDEVIKVPRILVVDDSITTRTLEKNILEAAGYEVVTMVDGKQAWDFLQEDSVDLVVTDIEMPDMNGFELTDKIKKTEAMAELPVIIVTSLARAEDQQRGIQVGANAYIVKGEFETRVLLDVVRQMV